jgi:hypothetical protein
MGLIKAVSEDLIALKGFFGLTLKIGTLYLKEPDPFLCDQSVCP